MQKLSVKNQQIAHKALNFNTFSDTHITLAEISEKIDKSLKTVNNAMKTLQEKGIIERSGGKKNGNWKVK